MLLIEQQEDVSHTRAKIDAAPLNAEDSRRPSAASADLEVQASQEALEAGGLTFSTQLLLTSRFPGLMSRCRIPAE